MIYVVVLRNAKRPNDSITKSDRNLKEIEDIRK